MDDENLHENVFNNTLKNKMKVHITAYRYDNKPRHVVIVFKENSVEMIVYNVQLEKVLERYQNFN